MSIMSLSEPGGSKLHPICIDSSPFFSPSESCEDCLSEDTSKVQVGLNQLILAEIGVYKT